MVWFAPIADSAAADEPFLAALRAAIERWPARAQPARFAVAFSGGLDSTLLLAALARLAGPAAVRALHVDHGLHAESAVWTERCAARAESLGVAFAARRVAVERAGGYGLEAAARDARYAALEELAADGEVVLTAHHADDQLETVLLRLMRGSGVRGLRGIADFAPFGRGFLGRPLLGFERRELRAQAAAWGLTDWIDDPANLDPHHDRNFLRLRVLPELAARWPAAVRGVARLTAQMSDAEEILAGVASADARALENPARVPRKLLESLPAARQRNLLRHLVRRAALGVPSAAKLEELRRALLDARPGTQPRIRWPSGEGRVFRGQLYLLGEARAGSVDHYETVLGKDSRWSGPEGEVRFEPTTSGPGLPEAWLMAGLTLRFRSGGERFKPFGRQHSQPLKRWLQQAAIVPWMRDRIPLFYRCDRLVAVGDLWLGDDVREAEPSAPCWRVAWTGHAPLR